MIMQVEKHSSLRLFLIQAFVVCVCFAQDQPGIFQFKVSEMTVSEDSQFATIVVENIGNQDVSADFSIRMSDISATSGVDYIGTAQTITFASGDATKEVNILIVDDSAIEDNEAFEVNLSLLGPARSNVTLGERSAATVVIQDNDQPPELPTEPPTEDASPTASAAGNDGGNITLDEEANIEVVCKAEYIEVTMQKGDYPGLKESSLHLEDNDCVPDDTNIDDQVVRFSFGLGECGTVHEDDGDKIFYKQNIHFIADKESDDDSITRKHSVVIPFQCGYDKKRTISKISYNPRTTKVITYAAGYGNFTYEMYMYESEDLAEKVEDFPHPVGLGLPMFFGFKVTSGDSELNVFPDVCKATAGPKYDSKPDHLIIENACSRDNTLKYDYMEKAQHSFSLSAFRWIGNYGDVYIHCKLTICRDSDTESRCARGCEASKRRRRSLEEDMSANVYIGPLSLKKMNDEAAGKQNNAAAESSNSMVMLVAVLVGVLGAVAIGLIVVVFIIGRRRRYAAVNKGVGLIVAEEM